MAEVLLVVILGVFFYRLRSKINLLKQKVYFIGVNDLKECQMKLERLKKALQDMDRKPFFSNQRDRDLEREIKYVLCDAQDIIEEFQTIIELRERGEHSFLLKKVQNTSIPMSSHFYKYVSWLGKKIKDVNKRIDRISMFMEMVDLGIEGPVSGEYDNTRETTQQIGARRPIGRKDDKEKIKKLLFHVSMESSVPEKHGVSIISIVGQGGIGKTTLAKMVFGEVKEQFGEHRWWVCVSQRPNSKHLLLKILKEVLKGSERDLEYLNSFSLSDLCVLLMRELPKKMFLLVLDDIWELDWWHGEVKTILMAGAKGSKILITNRNEDVSYKMGASHMHKLRELTFNESWSLFLEMVCMEKSELVNHNLEHIANKIVKKCGGLPLVVQTVGQLMRTKKMDKYDWETIEKREIWEWEMPSSSSSSVNRRILHDLILSYDDLPHFLRGCFIYCCIYPKGHEIGRDELVMQWVAHGFVEENNAIDVEVTANEYINDLTRRCLIGKTEEGNLKFSNTLHDLASYIGGKEYSHASTMEHTHHLSLLGAVNAEAAMHDNLRAENRLRTLLVGPHSNWVNIVSSTNLNWLRVLSLKHCGIYELPDSIGHLSLLKYLDLSYSEVRKLPTSIGRLHKLQTLNLNYSAIEELPKEIGKLFLLRYLGLKDTQNLNFIAEGLLGKLTNLRTLHKFIVCNDRENTRGCNIKEVKELKYIKGKLSIGGLGGSVKVFHANEARLKEKHGLISLELNFKTSQDDDKVASASEQKGVLEALEPPHGLENLKICHYKGQMPTWYLGTNYVKLKSLKINKCDGLNTIGDMPVLNSLKINKCDGLNTIGYVRVLKSLTVEYSKGLKTLASMPALERLKVYACDSLEKVVHMPSLLHLQVKDCKQLRELANMPALKTLYLTSLPSLIRNDLLCLTSLKEVGVFNLDDWEGWPAEPSETPISMPCLIEASFGNCAKMKMQGLVHVLSEAPDCQLQRLAVWNCPSASLEWQFFKHLPSLITLNLDRLAFHQNDDRKSAPYVPSLSEVSTFLPSLKSLCLVDGKGDVRWGKVPQWVWGLTRLEELLLIDFSEEVSLGRYWQCLQKLRRLRLSWFPKLKSLVDNIPSAHRDEQIACLSNLKTLGICHCPALHLPSELRKGLGKRLLEHNQIDFLQSRKDDVPEPGPPGSISARNSHLGAYREIPQE